jgi:hypothetical protein
MAARKRKQVAPDELCPHGRENGRTERLFSARKGKLSAQVGKSRTKRFFVARTYFMPKRLNFNSRRPAIVAELRFELFGERFGSGNIFRDGKRR